MSDMINNIHNTNDKSIDDNSKLLFWQLAQQSDPHDFDTIVRNKIVSYDHTQCIGLEDK